MDFKFGYKIQIYFNNTLLMSILYGLIWRAKRARNFAYMYLLDADAYGGLWRGWTRVSFAPEWHVVDKWIGYGCAIALCHGDNGAGKARTLAPMGDEEYMSTGDFYSLAAIAYQLIKCACYNRSNDI